MRFIDRLFAYGVSPFNPFRWNGSREGLASVPEAEQYCLELMLQHLEGTGEQADPDRLRGAAREMVACAYDAPRLKPDLEELADLPVFAADDVARYVTAIVQDGGVAIESQTATMAPPFDEFWIDIDRVPNHLQFRSWGVHVKALENDGSWEPMPGNLEAPRWQLDLFLYIEADKGDAMGPIAHFVAGLAEDGTWHRDADGELWWYGEPVPLDPPVEWEERRSMGDALVIYLAPVLMAISLMHCTNVELERVEPNPKLSKKQQKRAGGQPLMTFHTLNIEPMRRLLDQMGASAGPQELRRALHLCRGHFKVFTEDAPLFGRHTGSYWWAPQVRGRAREGVALKDYRVAAPTGFGRAYREAPEEAPEPPPAAAGGRSNPDAYGRGLVAHNRTQNQLAEILRDLRMDPVSPGLDEPDFDLGFKIGDRAFVVEVKSLTEDNEEFQLRLALGQVLRYRQKLTAAGHGNVQALVAVERPPTDMSWDSGFELDGVVLLWPEVWTTRLQELIERETSDA